MNNIKWKTNLNHQVFDTAKENMAFDESLLHSLAPNERLERTYVWPHPSITYSYKQTCPPEMLHIDHSKRITGGGLVFHSPGDLLFSTACWLDDPKYPGSLIQKLGIVSDQIKTLLTQSGISLDKKKAKVNINYDHCLSYPTPFEIIINGQKRCGLTIRKLKDRCLIQGIIHTATTHPSFNVFVAEKNRFNIPINLGFQ